MTIYRRTWRNRHGDTKRAWLVEVTIDGMRRRKQFATLPEAVAGKASFKAPEMERPVHQIKNFEQLCAAHIAELTCLGRERSTIESYEGQLRRHIQPLFVNTPIEEIDRGLALQIMNKLTTTLSPKYAHVTFSAFRRVMSFAHDTGIISTNPVAGLRFRMASDRRISAPTQKLTIPSKADIRTLVDRIEWGDGKLRSQITRADIVAVLGLYAGLRPSETRGLRCCDVIQIQDACYVRIAQRADNYRKIGPVKTDAALRDVPIARRAYTLMSMFNPNVNTDCKDLLLPGSDLKSPFDYSNFVRREWDCYLAGGSNLDSKALKITLHALRHCYASLQIEQGIDPKTLQKRMGHTSIQVTYDIYGHLWTNHSRDAEDAEAHDAKLYRIQQGEA